MTTAWLQRRFALSEGGARDLLRGSLACALQNLSLMMPVGILHSLVMYLISIAIPAGAAAGLPKKEDALFYAIACFLSAGFILVATRYQYNGTYLATYRESGVRRIDLAEKLRRIPLSFFDQRDLADLTSAIMNDCAVLETSQSHFVAPLIGSMISTSLVALSLLAVDWRMGLAALWPLPAAFSIVAFSARVQQGLSRRSMRARLDCEEGVQEFLEAIRDLRSNNATEAYLNGLDEKVRGMERRAVVSEFATAAFVVSASLVLRLGLASVALLGSILFSGGSLSMPVFFLFLLAGSRLYDPLEVALQNLAAIIATRSNIERMNGIRDCPVQGGRAELSHRGFDIVFDRVGFAYGDGEEVLRDVSFTARQGEVTALVGPSGGGKTTAVRLAARFWDVGRGRITVGGMDVSGVDPETLLSLYSIVFQDVTLFDGTVMENIRIGKRDASDEEVREAARLASCEEFILRLPDGWDSRIGENGCRLSGGERQRISIARAFLKDAPVILLDEATASLDVENETAIQSALSRLIRDKTVLVIAHRMRTVAGADKIVVLRDGTVAEQGTPEELLRRGGIYAHMAALQAADGVWGLTGAGR